MRLLLAGVFLVAAVGKGLGFAGAVSTVAALGVPRGGPAAFAAGALIASELSLGVALLWRRTMAVAAPIAAASFAGFTLVTIGKLVTGAPHDCGCFGALLSLPPAVGLAVDAILMALAGWLVAQSKTTDGVVAASVRQTAPPPDIPATGRATVLGLTAVCALLLGFSHLGGDGGASDGAGQPTHRVLIGHRLPEFRLHTPSGEILTAASFAGRTVFVLFVKPGCEPCHVMAAELAAHVEAWKGRLAVVLVARAPATPSARFWRTTTRGFPSSIALLADPGGVVSDAVTDRMPYGLLLDTRGVVRWISDGFIREAAEGTDALDRWVHLTPTDDADAAVEMPLLFGRPLSAGLSLPLWTPAAKPSGERLNLSSGAAVLTFASPACGSCAKQIESLCRLAVEHPDLPFVLVGRSSAEIGQLTATYLQDSPTVKTAVVDAAAGRSMGVRGVPTTMITYNGRVWFCTSAESREAELVRAVVEVGALVSRARTAGEPPPVGLKSYGRE